MGLKNKAKAILGDNGIYELKKVKGAIRHCSSKIKNSAACKVCDDNWKIYKTIQDRDRHVFFGYYDIQQLDRFEKRLLLTKVPIHAKTNVDKAELLWLDMEKGEEHEINWTSAWCWQQGARLRWHPLQDDAVLFNDVRNGKYVTRVWDVKKNQEIQAFPRALYDVTPDMRYGFSLNYSRLQRLRPGYGYNMLPDDTKNIKAPSDDGLFRVNLETGSSDMMISLSELSEKAPESIELWNYINHISVSPSGKRVMFFHIWTPSPTDRWMVRLYTIDVDGSNLKCLEKEYRASHYCWIDDDHILITAGGFPNRESRYIVYDIMAGTGRILDGEMLKNDGHPTLHKDGNTFITDTYPLGNNRQRLYESDMKSGNDRLIADIYSDPRMFEEKRCDLHPRVALSETIISVDSTCMDGKREVLIFKRQ